MGYTLPLRNSSCSIYTVAKVLSFERVEEYSSINNPSVKVMSASPDPRSERNVLRVV